MNDSFLKTIFWLSAGLVSYVYLVYPALLYLLSRWFPQKTEPLGVALPSVSLVISAYNEVSVIGEKLENALTIDYPRDLMEVLVISDCSDDGTDELVGVRVGQGVHLVRQSKRLGKSAGLNLGVPESSGAILIFSDANAIYQTDAIRQLVRHFADPRIGYVVGHAKYVEQSVQAPSAESEGLYWKLETWLKERESRFGSVVGGDGAIYAIRRGLFSQLRPTDINDLLNPLQIIASGYRGVYEPSAICYEEAGDSFEKEFRRKVRIVGRSLNAVWRAWRVLLPWTQPRHWFSLVSHKLLRWFVPVFLLLSLSASLFLLHLPFYRVAALLQASFYGMAASAWIVGRRRNSTRVLYIPYYFCLVNTAALLGIIQFFRGSLSPTWQTIREKKPVDHESAPIAQGGHPE
jgi:cellulose synthase/poly-beta-1,6-N-acetylglucosamine synthase-like glycosyltransferase